MHPSANDDIDVFDVVALILSLSTFGVFRNDTLTTKVVLQLSTTNRENHNGPIMPFSFHFVFFPTPLGSQLYRGLFPIGNSIDSINSHLNYIFFHFVLFSHPSAYLSSSPSVASGSSINNITHSQFCSS